MPLNHIHKSKVQLIEELKHVKQRILELEMSLKVYEEECVRRRENLETSFDYLQTVIDNIEDPILVIDSKYHIILANKKVKEFAGGTDPVKEGRFCYEVSHRSKTPCRGKTEPCPLKKILKTKSPVIVTHTHYDSAGNKILVEIAASPVLDKSGTVIHIIESCRDITERRKIEEQLRQSEARYRSLFEQSSGAIFIIQAEDPEIGKILSANKTACLMHGYTKKEMLKLSIMELDAPEDAAKTPECIKRILAGEILRSDLMHKRKDGTVFPAEVSAALMQEGDKKHILAIYRNISERKQAEEERSRLIKELEHISQTDGLTDLLNRQHLDKRLTDEIRRANRYGTPLSLIMFDVDDFKEVNDTYGHLAGDKILQKIAVIIKETIRETDIAGRFGGDEFIIILVQTDLDVAMQVAKRIRAKIGQARVPHKKEQTVSFTVSQGLCQYSNKLKNIEEFVSKADRALYMAKYTGSNQIYKAED